MAQTKADRSAAAKKAAATRKRNEAKAETAASNRGKKAAATRQGKEAKKSADQAKQSAGQAKQTAVEAKDTTSSAIGHLTGAAKSAGDAAFKASKSVVTRVRGSF